jgi:hypothetical protein
MHPSSGLISSEDLEKMFDTLDAKSIEVDILKTENERVHNSHSYSRQNALERMAAKVSSAIEEIYNRPKTSLETPENPFLRAGRVPTINTKSETFQGDFVRKIHEALNIKDKECEQLKKELEIAHITIQKFKELCR